MWEPGSPFLTPSMPIVTLVPAGDVQSSDKLTFDSPPFLPAPVHQAGCKSRSSKMTRGRKKDLTIPPTRALVQQRDYRARRAQYVNDLEERCRRAEEENAQLRKELNIVRAGQSPAISYDPQTVRLVALFPCLRLTLLPGSGISRTHAQSFTGVCILGSVPTPSFSRTTSPIV